MADVLILIVSGSTHNFVAASLKKGAAPNRSIDPIWRTDWQRADCIVGCHQICKSGFENRGS